MSDHVSNSAAVSVHVLRRLPQYLNYLKSLDTREIRSISAPAIAKALQLNEVQVRKDLAIVSAAGKPRTGFALSALINDIESYLGYDNVNEAVLVGAGQLGRALLSYSGFESCGLKIAVAFDADDSVVGMDIGGKKVFPVSKLKDLCKRMNIHIGIITVPADQAQSVCDRLVDAGILAIWNFAPVHLTAPEDVIVQNENMAHSLAVLSKRLKEKRDVSGYAGQNR